jgi:4-hydroxy-tetrahydrodipicolinate reductase
MGFGEPLEQKAILENPQVLIFAWGHTIPMIADAIGAELDKIDTVYEKWETPERIVFPHGVIEAGTCGAVRFEIRGWIGGEPRIVVEHTNPHRRRPPRLALGPLPLAAPEDRGERRLSHRDRGQPEHRAGDRVPRRGRRCERGRLPRHRHARGERDSGGVRGEAGAALAARSAADSRLSQHAFASCAQRGVAERRPEGEGATR